MITFARDTTAKEWCCVVAVGLAGYGAARVAQALFCCPPGVPEPPIPDAKEDSYVVGLLKRTFFRHFYVVRRGESLMRFNAWCNEFKNRPFTMKIFLHSHIVISDPLDAEQILVRQEPICVKGFGYDLVRSVIGDGLLAVSDKKKHQRHRRLLAPLFGTENIKTISNEVTRRYAIQLLASLLTQWQAAPAGAAEPISLNLTVVINAMALSAFGEGAFCANPDESVQVRAHFDTMMKFTKMNYFCPYLHNKSQRMARAAVADITDILLSKHVNVMADGDGAPATPPRYNTVLSGLMANLDSAFTPSDVVDHLVTFLFAGHDTTSHTLQMLVVLLAAHPEVQKELHAVLANEVMPSTGVFPMVDQLLHCEYLCAVVDEVLRLFPAAPLIYRDTLEDLYLPNSDVVVPKHSTVVLSIFSIHRNKSIYGDDADTFRPSRWIGAEGAALRARCGGCGFMPFSRGRRNCIGQEFGYQEALLVTAFLVRYLTFHADGEFPETRFLITMSTKEQVKVRFAKRDGFDAAKLVRCIKQSLVAQDDDNVDVTSKAVWSPHGSERDNSEGGSGAETAELRTPSESSFLAAVDSASQCKASMMDTEASVVSVPAS